MTERDEQTRARLLAHAAAYPQAQIQDYMKYLYQSAFGCEHLIGDAGAAAAYIRREAATARQRQGDRVEPLDGDFCRVHLDVLGTGLSPETFAALFALSAAHRPDGERRLAEKLAVLDTLLAAGELPLDAQEARTVLDAWAQAGRPACHHSQAFRDAYAPAYRLMRSDYARLLPLFARIDREIGASGHAMVRPGDAATAALLRQVYACEESAAGMRCHRRAAEGQT